MTFGKRSADSSRVQRGGMVVMGRDCRSQSFAVGEAPLDVLRKTIVALDP